MEQPRYVVADEPDCLWGHLFTSNSPEVYVRFVYDREVEQIVAMQVRTSRGWRNADDNEISDVEDSLKNANPDAIDNPEGWGLIACDNRPDWAPDTSVPQMGH